MGFLNSINSTKNVKPKKEENPLHRMATHTQIFTLSGLREGEIRDHSFLTNEPHDIIARTGGIGDNPKISSPFAGTGGAGASDRIIRDAFKDFRSDYSESIGILKRGHDIFFENVNILSTVGPNVERNLANFTKMEFELHEPFGITFIEKVRAATALCGFRDYQDAPLLLTIEFKGFDENGRPYYTPALLKRRIPILIAKVDFDVNEGGAKYNVTAVPYTDLAFDDRFKFPRTTVPLNANSMVEWVSAVSEKLDKQMQDEIDEKKRQYKDIYEFEVHPEVIRDGGVYESPGESIHSTATQGQIDIEDTETTAFGFGDPKPFKGETTLDSNTSLIKCFEDVVRHSYGYLKLTQNFWVSWLRTFNYDVTNKDTDKIKGIIGSKKFANEIAARPFLPWFKIKTTIYTDTRRLDKVTKMHPKIIKFTALPYQIHVLKLIAPGVSVKADWSQFIRKEYNYLYTGDNVDVQGLRINYKTAYYMRNVREKKSTTEAGIWANFLNNLKEVFGKETDPEPTLPLRQYPSIVKGRSTVDTQNAENPKAQEFYDYLTNPEADMMRIELDILGDPAYIAQDMYMPLAKGKQVGRDGEVFDESRHSFNVDQFMPCINLRYRLPDDIDEKVEGTMFSAKKKYKDENLFFSGVYQVVKVESKIDAGQFLQTLICVRLNNQDGTGVPAELVLSARKGFDQEKKGSIFNIGPGKNATPEKGGTLAGEAGLPDIDPNQA